MRPSDLQMNNLFIDEIKYKFNPNFVHTKDGVGISIGFALHRQIREDEKKAIIMLRTELFNEELTEKMPFHINIVIGAIFKWEDLSNEQLKQVLTENVASILFSYTRPLIAQITSMSNMPPLHLQLMNFKDIEVIDVATPGEKSES